MLNFRVQQRHMLLVFRVQQKHMLLVLRPNKQHNLSKMWKSYNFSCLYLKYIYNVNFLALWAPLFIIRINKTCLCHGRFNGYAYHRNIQPQIILQIATHKHMATLRTIDYQLFVNEHFWTDLSLRLFTLPQCTKRRGHQ